jgi:phosphopantothenoylcysteine decarboxylase / phosphopantothenate---cysteine ligase
MLLKDRKLIVTGGPTREWLDPVRFISNPSSGKMGIAIADAGEKLCREVVLIHGPVHPSLVKEKQYRTVAIESTGDLLGKVLKELEPGAILVMAAAPADYTPSEKSQTKMKKKDDELVITFKRTPDILKNVAQQKNVNETLEDLIVVGFAAETNDIENYGRTKLRDKKLNMICVNDVGRNDAGFASDNNRMTILVDNGNRIEIPLMEKTTIASCIMTEIDKYIRQQK